MLRSDHWDPWLIAIVAATVCGLVILAATLGCGVLAPRLARWKARRHARRQEVHLEALRAALHARVGNPLRRCPEGVAPPHEVWHVGRDSRAADRPADHPQFPDHGRRHEAGWGAAAIGHLAPDLVRPGDADARCAPLGAVIEGEAIAGCVGAAANDPPAAADGRAETQDILAARSLDVASRLATADLAALELGGRGGGQPVAVEAEGAGNPAVGGPDGPLRAARAYEPHQDEVGRVVGDGQRAGRDRLVVVYEVGLVAGVAVGDGDRGGSGPEPAGPGVWVRSDTTGAEAP